MGAGFLETLTTAITDAGREAAEKVRQTLVSTYAPDVWDRMSPEERQAAAEAAFADYRAQYSSWVPWTVAGVAGAVAFTLLRGR